jgi:outer membrane protein W
MRTTTAIAAALLTLGAAATVQAQDAGRFSLELRTGAAVATTELGERDLDTPGVGFEITANFQVMPHLNLYAGWDWTHFSLSEELGAYDDFEDTGYAFGARFFAPSLGAVTPWLRAGGVYDHIEMESQEDGADDLSADHVLGWEAGAGAAIALGQTWSLLPGVRYRTFSPELDVLGGGVDVSYVSFEIGIAKTFGGPALAAIRHR